MEQLRRRQPSFDDEAAIESLKPLNLYGKSKQDFVLWALEQVRRSALKPKQWVGLKFFNVFGPGEAHKGRMASVVFHGFNQIRDRGRIRLFKSHRPEYADGGQLRDFIYVRDAVEVMLKLAGHLNVNGLFNLGTAQARSFEDLGKALFAALGLEPRIEYIPMPEDLQRKYQFYTQATMRKLRAAGIEHQFISLEQAVRDYTQNDLSKGSVA